MMNRSQVLAFILLSAFAVPPTSAGPAVLDTDDPLPIRTDSPEQIPGVTTYYRSVAVGDDTRLRVLVTRPDGVEAPLNPLFLTQWVSCGPLHYRPRSSTSKSLALLAQHSGLSLVRVERSGSGDSSGPPCSELDYDTEIAHYQQAFGQVLESGDVDASRIYFFGSSLGSTTAPLLARYLQDQGYTLGGVAVQGGGAYSYLERMLAFEQNYLDRRPSQTRLEDRTVQYQQRVRFLVEYLVNQRHPDDIAGDSTAMALIRDDILGMDDESHYGRPYRWHQQAAQYNFAAAWSALEAPVLVIYNEYDQYEAPYGATLLADTVNRGGRGSAEFKLQQGLGHSSGAYADALAAYAGEGGVSAWSRTAGQLVAWLQKQVKAATDS